ncbi:MULTISPECIES: alanine--tRNA ligase [Streptomyces]|uniref:alanine--tRNA ligase n=1 Tax=Streptomyces TaxID=1883 RepID=UPI0024A29E2F|nr:alanine--tRNA ligase [Streptomyces lavendulae]GLX20783.1 alanine--tRNA ligase [Streptomyces lavendulae subsp. lavendulae]GLX28055.1 alanine--tRNA ligase [Streptomyces lavendulae subsp. lavendulae]
MRSTQIRSTFLDFFTSRGHRQVPSSPLIPSDPTLLLANAGMNQFKPYFLGEVTPEYRRATTIQKCARTSDIDNVGRTNRHATFFEMMGNFSFGDYFKADAIAYAWELLTQGYNLEKDRLWITVYEDDDEAEQLWRKIGVPAERIQRLGMEDNYWSMGVPGPCGPCSEVNYDRGPAFGREGGPAVDGERYVEIWNLVFMQYQRGEGDKKGDFPILGELAQQSIDTGLGLDRLAAILQDVENVCTTDLLQPTLNTVQELAGRDYPGSGEEKISFQVVTEHARSIAYLIADGVLPAKDGRGYVLRRLMRRAIRHARLLGIDQPVLAPVTASVIANLGDVWPELTDQANLIGQVVTAEEESFSRTLAQGTRLLNAAITRTREGRSGSLPGETAFELADTYGFPLELTVEAAQDAGLTVDEDRFATLLDEQRKRAKTGGKAKTADALRRQDTYRELSAHLPRTEFLGYEHLTAEVTVLGLISGGAVTTSAPEGSDIEFVLDRSPFYAEAGGQIGDTGTLRTDDGTLLRITDTRYGLEGFRVHSARVLEGELRTGARGEAAVDADRRKGLMRSHSATHILHAVVRATLGDHARQQGSLVESDRLRFDFAHFSAVTPEQLARIEAAVNGHVLDDPAVRAWHADRAEAEAAGAIALFGEKYGDTVRIVDIGDFSRELCGGTHVAHGSQVGAFRLISEGSIGSNLRRIEALTGHGTLRHHDTERRLLDEVSALLTTRPKDAPETLRKRLDALSAAQQELGRLRETELRNRAQQLAASARQVAGGRIVTQKVTDLRPDELRTLAAHTADLLNGDRAVVVFATGHTGKAHLAAAVTRSLHDTGVQASQILTAAARSVGGGAGGKGTIASAGGRRTEALDQALAIATEDAARVLGR